MSVAPVVMLAPYVVELLTLAMSGIKIMQKPDITIEELEEFKNACLASEKRLDAELAAAIERRA